jgi:putative membrane protein
MFIDYLTLLLANMSAALTLLGIFLLRSAPTADPRAWSAPFLITGLIAFIGGLHITLTWPLPGPYNMFFGESSVLLGAILLGIALALGMGWSTAPLAAVIPIAALVAILLGCRIMNLGLTAAPTASGLGFILAGIGGLLTAAAFAWTSSRPLKIIAAIVLLVTAALWLFVGLNAYWGHAKSLSDWQPTTMKPQPPKNE